MMHERYERFTRRDATADQQAVRPVSSQDAPRRSQRTTFQSHRLDTGGCVAFLQYGTRTLRFSDGVTNDLEMLCRSCGLCCDGSLFGSVTLQSDEVRRARKSRLVVLQRGNAFEQPCAALSTSGDRCACSIYAERSRACREFTCRLHDRHRREGGPLEVRLEAVRRVRMLLRVVETTADERERAAAIAELTRRMEADFARASSGQVSTRPGELSSAHPGPSAPTKRRRES